ncbi:hypothetical protein M413DRAFT_66917 [Hebeloma cylindrosporum]|uniref:Uncharacterized protein n=1 Tax=Hebeloma cylindrosporum TaxID=76867 RepID=A0A0C2Y3Y4_HEBCY|nr:hypothetical protein M413DRAFT_66917 [Hebeloma cylindrosporum h7]
METPSQLNYSRRSSVYSGERKPLLLTGYRFLVIFLTTIFGLWKASLSYHGHSTSPNTLDWLYGVFAFLTLYWLGIYERHAIHNKRWIYLMFEVDYLAVLWRLLKDLYRSVVSSEDGGSPFLPGYIHFLSAVTASHGLRLRDD